MSDINQLTSIMSVDIFVVNIVIHKEFIKSLHLSNFAFEEQHSVQFRAQYVPSQKLFLIHALAFMFSLFGVIE